VCASDSYDVCMSDSCDVYECLHEFDFVQGSPTQIMAQIRTSERHHGVDDPRFYNPLRDHSLYEIEFPDGTTDEIEANLIAECMVSECDPDGRQYRMWKEISDHLKDVSALNVANGSYRTRAGNLVPKRTTKFRTYTCNGINK